MKLGLFGTPLIVRKLSESGAGGRAEWLIVEPLLYHSMYLDEIVHVHEGFVTDFATVPRLPMTYLLAGDTGHASAVVHDFLLQEPRERMPWSIAANVFHEALLAEGVPPWRAALMYAAVRAAGPFIDRRP
jgi:hypothetical protein